jgi:hypothetical protein
MWSLEQLTFLTVAAAAALIVLAVAAFFLLIRKLPHRPVAAHVVTVTVTVAATTVTAVALNHLWAARRERDARIWAARGQHLQQLQRLLRAESESLKALASALRVGRYFTLVANDAREAVWHDDVLTSDVGHHFPEYFQDREQLIREVLGYDTEMGRLRQIISASLPLPEAGEPFRTDLVSALVSKCGGAASGVSLARMRDASTIRTGTDHAAGSAQASQTIDPVQTYEQYQCGELSRACRNLLDRAADLADTASTLSDSAGRYAHETVLHGSCTYAPGE